MSKHITLATVLLGAFCIAGRSEDWPQYRGPNHDGTSSEKILKAWPTNGPTELWKTPLTDGFSAFAVGGGRVYTLVARDVDSVRQEVCVALDAKTGKELWASAPLGISKYDGGGDNGTADNKGGDGPRSTPAYDNGKIYTYSSRMVLSCFEASSGKQLWSNDLIKDHGGRNIKWQSAASPLVEDKLVYVACGGPGESLMAFDKETGAVAWKGQDDGMTHSTPIATTILGKRQVIFYTQKGLVAVEPKTGDVLWRFPFKYQGSAAISPIVSGDMVYCSAAYNVGSGACKITKDGDKFTATELWVLAGNAVNNHWSSPVCSDGYIYGLFGQAKFGRAPLQCLELSTGKVLWSQDGFGPGGCTLVDGHVMVLSDAGDLVLVKATSTAYTEVARAHILAGKCWNPVSLSNGRIYARSTKEGVCLDVSPQHAAR